MRHNRAEPLTRRAAEGNLDLVAGTVVVPAHLGLALGHADRVEGGDLWRGEGVERGVDVPAG